MSTRRSYNQIAQSTRAILLRDVNVRKVFVKHKGKVGHIFLQLFICSAIYDDIISLGNSPSKHPVAPSESLSSENQTCFNKLFNPMLQSRNHSNRKRWDSIC